jgi:hypothetical protein
MNIVEMRAIVQTCSFPNLMLAVFRDDTRPYLQVSCLGGVCNITMDSKPWKGRKWFLSEHMTRSEIVGTAFKAVLTAMEHETREQFTYRGQAVFGPHIDVDRLALLLTGDPNLGADARAEPLATSGYLNKPLRTIEQARRDIPDGWDVVAT